MYHNKKEREKEETNINDNTSRHKSKTTHKHKERKKGKKETSKCKRHSSVSDPWHHQEPSDGRARVPECQPSLARSLAGRTSRRSLARSAAPSPRTPGRSRRPLLARLPVGPAVSSAADSPTAPPLCCLEDTGSFWISLFLWEGMDG